MVGVSSRSFEQASEALSGRGEGMSSLLDNVRRESDAVSN